MAWQYMHEGEIRGPLSDDEFLAALPAIAPSAKIHKEGWEQWRRLDEVAASELPQAPAPPPIDEGASQPAGFWRRAGAFITDFLLIRFLTSGLPEGNGYSGWSVPGAFNWSWNWSGSRAGDFFGWAFLATLAYEGFMISRWGWTLGKFAFGLRVSHEGRKLTLARSLARVAAKKLNLFTLFLGYLMAAWNKDKKALHDHLCSTRVYLR